MVIGGLSAHFRYHEIVAIWGVFPILAGWMGGVELINPLAIPPTAESIETKRGWVQRGFALLLLSLLAAVAGGLILAAL